MAGTDANRQGIEIDTGAMGWGEAASYPAGAQSKVLLEDGESRTILLKLPPGFRMDVHTHTCREQHFVIEGAYEVRGKTFPAGSYRCIAPREEHGPFTSGNGAVVLVVWGP